MRSSLEYWVRSAKVMNTFGKGYEPTAVKHTGAGECLMSVGGVDGAEVMLLGFFAYVLKAVLS